MSDDLRIARLHLRVGMLTLALAELEDLERRGLLSNDDRAMLAEARWRSGDSDGAAAAARANLDAGGDDPVAICIAAEAAAADGRPGEARSLMDRLGPPDATTLDALFGGMPRRAFWPSAPADVGEAETLFGDIPRVGERRTPSRSESGSGASTAAGAASAVAAEATVSDSGTPRRRESSVPGPREVLDATAPGLWSAAGEAGPEAAAPLESVSPGRPRHVSPTLDLDPVAELHEARAELAATPDRALLRLALTLRADPTLAPAVLDLVAGRTEPLAAILRGDAQRLLGRHLEAEAAFASAAAGLGDEPRQPRS
ncbi:MAG TPA: hypothetical protein VKR30_09235 [Candidatus Limnocylindrales bacterium]|nr:hypothetical protein [Candidatus Limnocylindrales bacterium]